MFNTEGMVCNAVSTLVLSPLLMIIYVAQGEAAAEDVEQTKNQSDQNEVCNTYQYFHKYLDGMSIQMPYKTGFTLLPRKTEI